MRNKDIESIAYLIKRAIENNQPKPIVFLGAGASISAGIPGSAQIIIDILKKFKEKPEIKNLAKEDRNYYNLMGCLNTEERHELLRNYISNDNVKINVTHIYLAQMLKEGYVDYVLTVNFDDLFLRACALFNFIPPVYDISILKDFTTTNLTEKSVTYLHGQHHGFWLLNTDEELEKVKDYIPTVFDRICNKRTWIVVGYSGEDPIFDQIARLGHFTNELFWVGYNENLPNERVQEQLINKPNSNVSLVSGYDADAFFLKLHSELKLSTPDIFNKPFSFLKELMGNIRDVEENLVNTGKHQQLFEKVKERYEVAVKQVEASIKLYEESDISGALTVEDINRDQLKKQIIEATLKEKYDEVDEFVKNANFKDGEINSLLSNLFNSWGLSISKNLDIDETERKTKAIVKYKKAIEFNNKNSAAYINWGNTLYKQSLIYNDELLYKEAIKKYKVAIQITPHNYSAFFNWGVASAHYAKLKKEKRMYLEAIEHYEDALKINQSSGATYQNLCNTFIEISKLVSESESTEYLFKAMKAAQKAIEMGRSAYNLACVNALLNKKAIALQILNRVLENKEISTSHVLKDDDWGKYLDDEEFKNIINNHIDS
jgi:tetratricopeptide (TPR) repeat protein